MSLEANRAACLRYNDAVTQGLIEVVDEVMDPDVVHLSAFPGQAPGIRGVKEAIQWLRSQVPDLTLTVDDIVAEGEKVWARYIITGTPQGEFLGIPASGKRFQISEYFAARFRNGRIVEFTSLQDRLSLMQQLGVTFPAAGRAV
jgi:hypothetical protein